jgi:hypothetical protein
MTTGSLSISSELMFTKSRSGQAFERNVSNAALLLGVDQFETLEDWNEVATPALACGRFERVNLLKRPAMFM